jgi:single-strand DNA-binding protein
MADAWRSYGGGEHRRPPYGVSNHSMETIRMQDNTVTVTGNLTDEPEVRFTASGTAVANFTIASASRMFDRTTNEWRNGETLFLRCTVWQQSAEHLADSLTKGTRVIVVGQLRQRSFETRDGAKRTSVELIADEIGVSLRYAVAKVTKTAKSTASAPTTEDQPA